MRFEGKRAVVTGGASGIGEAVCRRFAEEGGTVLILDIDKKSADRLAADLPGACAVYGDVADSASVDAAFAEIVRLVGGVEVLVNNAGAPDTETAEALQIRAKQIAEAKPGAPEIALNMTSRMSDQQWHREMAIYLHGTFYCTRAALRLMLPNKKGAIVNVSSIHGIAGGTGLPHYSAAKAGILGFTRSVAKEVMPMGVRVNAITPGYIQTPATDKFMPPALREAIIRQVPAKRLGAAEEVAALVAFLAADESSFITGETISPDGGWLTV
jgi:3-oxoacyl-[acyl-carrier protein] reductase